jgi:predicted ATPase/transcriptional regulator with XRE-family HTH domain
VEHQVEAPGPPNFGRLLRRYRLAAGLSQEGLAERARMSVNGISALERGYRRMPRFETLSLLSGALALSSEQRQEFVLAAARSGEARGKASVTVGPWSDTAILSLPSPLTSFVGRSKELEEIAALMREHRFVTLTGPGGAGKTRIAAHVSIGLSDAGRHAVCFTDLSPIGDPSLVAATIAAALGAQEVPKRPLLQTLVTYLKNKELLLILDNCEHVIAQASTAAETLLGHCPRVRILATSREPFRSAGEQAYRLPPLSEEDAIVLFADRARAVDHRFALSAESATVVEQICRRLEGLPLAIELAAARIDVLTLSALAATLDDRLQVLSRSARTALPRQQAMRATIDWSYNLLPEPEQRLFERLSIFSGGCTIDAAKAVCADDPTPGADLLDLIASLVSKSLLMADLEGTEPRYRMLELFRQYAREKLKVRGEESLIGHRHALTYLELAGQYSRRRDEPHGATPLGNPSDEIDNWRSVVQRALNERADVLLGQLLVAELIFFGGGLAWISGDARRWILSALALVDQQTPAIVVARLWRADASMAFHLDNHERQLESSEKAIAHYRATDNQLGLILAQRLAGNALYDLGRAADAQTILSEALVAARTLGSGNAVTQILRDLACACMCTGDFGAAHRYLDEALQLLNEAHDEGEHAWAMLDVASLSFAEGNPELAVAQVAQTLARGTRAPGSRINVAGLNDLSLYLIALDRYDDAAPRAREALALARETQLDVGAVHALQHLAVLAILQRRASEYEKAARILGFVGARLGAVGSTMPDEFKAERDRALVVLREALGADAAVNHMAEGTAMSEEYAFEEVATIT